MFDGASDRVDVAALLGALCRVAVRHLDFAGASVSLASPPVGGSVDLEVVAAVSDDAARAVHELELALGEGPGRDALALGRPVLTSDLAEQVGRWPGYATAAGDLGVRSVFAFPLGVGAARFGVQTVHRADVHSLTRGEVAEQLALAQLATEILLDLQVPGASAPARPGFINELELADEIFQAQGMVSVQLDLSLPEALAALRAHAYAEGRRLRDLAVDVVDGRVRLPDHFRHHGPGDDNHG